MLSTRHFEFEACVFMGFDMKDGLVAEWRLPRIHSSYVALSIASNSYFLFHHFPTAPPPPHKNWSKRITINHNRRITNSVTSPSQGQTKITVLGIWKVTTLTSSADACEEIFTCQIPGKSGHELVNGSSDPCRLWHSMMISRMWRSGESKAGAEIHALFINSSRGCSTVICQSMYLSLVISTWTISPIFCLEPSLRSLIVSQLSAGELPK